MMRLSLRPVLTLPTTLSSGKHAPSVASKILNASDARFYQIVFQIALLTAGVLLRDFSLRPMQVALAIGGGLATQAYFLRRMGRWTTGFKSAVITCLGVSLLVRADNFWVHPLVAALAMASKFILRIHGKHIFNPANLGAMLAILFFPGAWISPGQWGQEIALSGWLIILGSVVVFRAHRSDISWAFLGVYLGLVALRVVWLGQPWPVWFHRFQDGGLLLFAFFMISDPMTIPNHRVGRILHAMVTAGVAFVWQFVFFKINGLLWALFLTSPFVPLWDIVWPAQKFQWRKT